MILACLLLFAVYYACKMGSEAAFPECPLWYLGAILVFLWSIGLAIHTWVHVAPSSEMAMLSVLYVLLFFTLYRSFKQYLES